MLLHSVVCFEIRWQIFVSCFLCLGYHYLVELELAQDMVKTGGEIFVAVHSNYEMLGNVSMTTK